jgi:hypothetical protein
MHSKGVHGTGADAFMATTRAVAQSWSSREARWWTRPARSNSPASAAPGAAIPASWRRPQWLWHQASLELGAGAPGPRSSEQWPRSRQPRRPGASATGLGGEGPRAVSRPEVADRFDCSSLAATTPEYALFSPATSAQDTRKSWGEGQAHRWPLPYARLEVAGA